MKTLLFNAKWCYPCRVMREMLKEHDLEDQFEFIDVDEEPDRVAEHGIDSIPTMVRGNRRLVGLCPVEQVKEFTSEPQP